MICIARVPTTCWFHAENKQLGEAGKRYCDALLSEEVALDRYERWIIDLADMRRRGDDS